MGNRNLLAVAVLVFTGLAYNTVPRGDKNAAAPGESAPSQPPAGLPAAAQLWTTLDEFKAAQCGAPVGKSEYLIVILPDPQKTHLSLYFDRGVESIQRAAADAQFYFDRYWLPWRENPYSATPSPEVRKAQEEERQAREELPGWMLFRGPEDKRLTVLVISETPTAGINRKAFELALQYLTGCTQARPVRIAGPTFSGSLASLRAAIETTGQQFRVISGSTTGFNAEEHFRESRFVTFSSVIHNDKFAQDVFFDYLKKSLGISEDQIAILSEADTAFGQLFRGQGQPGVRDVAAPKHEILMSFPREIALLRNAYREDFLTQTPAQLKQGPQEGVSLTLHDPNSGQDSVPSYSRAQTPVSQEAVLQNIAGVLRREEVRFAGIAATDPLDTFFLSRYLINACPNVRLFQLDADLLFVRPPESLPLEGMLSVTTYPLFTRNQYWTPLDPNLDRRTIFPARYGIGMYNACRALLDPNLPPESLIEYASPRPGGRADYPPLWLTAAGRNGYWPIALLTENPDKDGVLMPGSTPPRPPGRFAAEEPSDLWTFVFYLLAVLSALLVFALWTAQRSGAAWAAAFEIPFPKDRSSHVLGRGLYLLFGVLLAAAAYGTFAGPVWALGFGRTQDVILRAISAVTASALLLVAAWLTLRMVCAYLQTERTFRDRWHVVLAAAAWGGFVAAARVWVFLLSRDVQLEGFFFAYRAVNFSSGLSPTLPMLFLAVAMMGWCWAQLQRVVWCQDGWEELPKLDDPSFNARTADLTTGIRDSLEQAFAGRTVLGPILLIAVAAVVYWAADPHLRTLEHVAYDQLFLISLALLFALMVSTCFQFLGGWCRVKRFLEHLELHPIRFALSDLPADRTWSPVWQSDVRKRNWMQVARALDCLRSLAALPDGPTEEVKPLLTALKQPVDQILADVACGTRVPPKSAVALQSSLNHAAERLVAVSLEQAWSRSGVEALKANPARHLAAEFVALRYLAYIRNVMMHLRSLLGFVTTAFLLAVLSLMSYPFQSPQIIGTFTLVVFVTLGGGVVIVLAQMNRDAILSRITNTEAGKLDRGFVLRVAEAGALPLLAVVSSNIPAVSRFLFSWVQPALERLH